MHLYLSLLYLCYNHHYTNASSNSNSGILKDSTIEFNYDFDSLEGWADLSTDTSQIDVKIESGELRGNIIGLYPVLDSPQMNYHISSTHYLIMRIKYSGAVGTTGKLLLQTGVSTVNFNTMPWEVRQIPSILSDSGSTSTIHTSLNLFDSNLQTYWETSTIYNAFLIFDFHDIRSINEIRILSSTTSNSPKKCIFQISSTQNGVGPFITISSFSLVNTSSTYQRFTGFPFTKSSRYYKLIFLNNYGGNTINLVNIEFVGIDNTIIQIPFDIQQQNDHNNNYKNEQFIIHNIPIGLYFSGNLQRIRLTLERVFEKVSNVDSINNSGNTLISEYLAIDYIRCIRSPMILHVTGCINQYYNDINRINPIIDVNLIINKINKLLIISSFEQNTHNYKNKFEIGTTYDCPHSGNILIQIDGYDFGGTSNVFINGEICEISERFSTNFGIYGMYDSIICMLPPIGGKFKYDLSASSVSVVNGLHSALYDVKPYLTYRYIHTYI